MKTIDCFRSVLISSLIAVLVHPAVALADDYECQILEARPVNKFITEEAVRRGDIAVRELVIEGINFGGHPKVWFGANQEIAQIVSIVPKGQLDAITLKLPAGISAGTYKLMMQNTDGPFRDDDGQTNPIFCFGSVTIGIVSAH
ncbi:MAG: hypothetical protein ACU843_13640 [Gammaproteobacteria bacterium]